MSISYNLLLKERTTNDLFFLRLKKKLSDKFPGLKFWGLRETKDIFDENNWQIVDSNQDNKFKDSFWRIGTGKVQIADQFQMRSSIEIFDVRPMKSGLKYHFSSNSEYWKVYVLKTILNSLALDVEGSKVIELGINSAYTKEIVPKEFKSFLDFLKQSYPKKLKTVRSFYLQELKKIPEEILEGESAIKNFI